MTASIQEVKAKYENQLMGIVGVVSVGIGKSSSGHPAIIVGLDQPRAETESQIPPSLEGYAVVVQVVGRIKAQ